MGFLQNHAIKKSCRGLAKELLNHVIAFISQLPNDRRSDSFDQLVESGLKNFVDTFQPHSGVNLELKSIRYSNWLELYNSILIKGVHSDLSYDKGIGTEEHNRLIIKVGGEILDLYLKEPAS